ncbi:DUF2284 domain-containing protein [Phascolarctobacterium sp.]|uniref:DUF2284 domain-containing protein n=1 Tax=Phascolarctobacterium sp. TaxID=2049039 RepID=UPI003077426B
MSNTMLEELTKVIQSNQYLTLMPIMAKNFSFEERVRLNCFYCTKYDTKWTCPPKIPNLDYEVVLSEYQNIAILKYERTFSKEEFDMVRNESTNEVHRMLLRLEQYLYEHNDSLAISFIGGSCKLCKNGCGKEKCNSPGMARIPLEAIGVNVIKSLANIGIKIKFPLEDKFYRFGLIAW